VEPAEVHEWQANQTGVSPFDPEVTRGVHQRERLMEPDRDVGFDPPDETHGDPRLGLGCGAAPRVVPVLRPRPPSVREVAVQVDAASVLSRVSGPAVRVQGGQDPQIEEVPRPTPPQSVGDPNAGALVTVDAPDDQDPHIVRIAPLEDTDRSALDRLTEELSLVDLRRRQRRGRDRDGDRHREPDASEPPGHVEPAPTALSSHGWPPLVPTTGRTRPADR
jgi:hypothetical protein